MSADRTRRAFALGLALTLIAVPASSLPAAAQDATACPLPARVFMPSFIGLDLAGATALAGDVGYVLTSSEEASDADAGTVIDQDPAPGEEVKPGDEVAVTVAAASAASDTAGLSWAQLSKRARTVKYKELLRNPDRYEGKLVKFRGEVLQATDDDEGGQGILVSVTRDRYGFWDDNVFLYHDGSPRVIPDDIVDFVMTATGNYGYESAGAGYLTVPSGFIEMLRIRS